MAERGPPAAWIVTLLGLWVLVSPFVFTVSGTYQTSLIVSGIIVAILGTWRALQPDEKIPLPALPIVVILLGIWTIASPFVFTSDAFSTHGITLIISGIIFIVIPAMMINQMINKQHAAGA